MKLTDAAVRHLRDAIDAPDAGARYDIGSLLGRGGMGAVYQATDHVLARDVALKVLSLDAESDALSQRLTREARILAQLEHPGIVAVHDAGVLADGRPFYVMRLVRGTWIDARARTLGIGEVLRLFLRACEAVAFAHARGVIHRDLTPRNVMVGEYGEVLVLDWGVASAVRDKDAADPDGARLGYRSEPGVVVGTPGFMAPEQALGAAAQIDDRVDVFGLGAILRVLVSEHSFPNARSLTAIVERATAPEPGMRYATVNELADDVRRWLDGEAVSAYREGPLERMARFYQRNKTLILLLAAYAVVRVVILLWRGV
ncbi:MAG: serine/threonine-protein kinase [Gemmatimonadaceae bacterium]